MQHYIVLALSVIVLIAFFALYKPKRKNFSWEENSPKELQSNSFEEKPEDIDTPDRSISEEKTIIVPAEITEKENPKPELKRYRLDDDFELITIAGVVYLVHDAKYSVTMLRETDGCPLSETRLDEKKSTFF